MFIFFLLLLIFVISHCTDIKIISGITSRLSGQVAKCVKYVFISAYFACLSLDVIYVGSWAPPGSYVSSSHSGALRFGLTCTIMRHTHCDVSVDLADIRDGKIDFFPRGVNVTR